MAPYCDGLSRLNDKPRGEVVRSGSHITLAHERDDLLQANNRISMNDNPGPSNSDNKQEVRIQQVAEDLIEAQGPIGSIRNESMNLAEK
jgi:nucleoprotein TPR